MGALGLMLIFLLAISGHVHAQNASRDSLILDAREAFGKRDKNRLAAALTAVRRAKHPLTPWVEYWDMNLRMSELTASEVDDFYTRWKSTYVEDRFRNDWLLELGRRREWQAFAADYPRFRMNDDKEVSCYFVLTSSPKGETLRQAGLAAWLAQSDSDTGCMTMASSLFEVKILTVDDVWLKARHALFAGRPKAAQQAVSLLGEAETKIFTEMLAQPTRFLNRKFFALQGMYGEILTLALIRAATTNPALIGEQLQDRWERKLPPELAAWAWFAVGKQAAINLQPEAHEYFQRAEFWLSSKSRSGHDNRPINLPDDGFAWQVRAALRAPQGPRWVQIQKAIDSMSPAQATDSTWVYWRARSLQGLAEGAKEPESQALQNQARRLLESIAHQMNFYGKLAAEDLGRPVPIPAKPASLTAEERANTVRNPGLDRALSLIAMGLRSEGEREWNFTLRGMNDRQLLAAAQWACDLEVWKTCINTSDRTQTEIDLTQRFPMPFRQEVTAQAQQAGLDPAYVYGLIRQESRFIMDARSHVGASGLMQLMPATARWTAKKIGLPYSPDLITNRDVNLKLGTSYLKLVLDDLGGSQAMAAAAYNAGPSRPRRWRDGPVLEVAAWTESIPFNETRDYVKKVLSNATYYSTLLRNEKPSLKTRMGQVIGPRDSASLVPNPELP